MAEINAEMAAEPIDASVSLHNYINQLQSLTAELLAQDSRSQSGNACDYLTLVSYVLYGYMWYKNLAALQSTSHSESFVEAKQYTAAYYFERVLPKVAGLLSVLRRDSAVMDKFATDHF